MAKNINNIQDYFDELLKTRQFDTDGDILSHIEQMIPKIEQAGDSWDKLRSKIQSFYGEFDKLSNKKYHLFNVKTFKDELKEVESEYANMQKRLRKETERLNAEWAKMSAEGIEEGSAEWMEYNNKLLSLQSETLKAAQNAANKAIDIFRNGFNVFDRFSAHVKESVKGIVKGVNEVKDGVNKSLSSVKEWTEPWARANQAAADFSKNVGLGAAGMKNLLSETIRFANQSQIGIKYNKSLEEMIKLQQEYTNSVGRNISLTDSYKESLAAMSAVMGDQKTADIAGKLENFGINPEETGKRIGKMYADASKKGIAFSKYSETFANNIKMAQNYTFANGVKGVASMAEKATKLKLEMMSVAQFADKVSTVEGAITTGAQLQVLGGPFSQFADPLQMLYEGTSDAEGLQDRIINMFGNLGRFNKLTGEVEVSAFDRQRIKAAGNAIGVNPAELMDMIHAKGRRNEVANQMRGLGYSNELQELIMNTASFDEKGNAGVSINGKFVGVDQLAGREQELIALNQTETEDIKEIATLLRGWDDTMKGFQKQRDAKQASWVERSGIGSFAMTAVQYLGQANWALNTIVGLLTAGNAINFGLGGYGMLQGGTRTVAATFAGTRMKRNMRNMGLDGGNLVRRIRQPGRNIGVLNAPRGSFNRRDTNSLITDFYRARGASRGAPTGTMPLNPIPRNNWFIPPTLPTTGIPSISPVVGTGSYSSPMNMGYGVPSISPTITAGMPIGGFMPPMSPMGPQGSFIYDNGDKMTIDKNGNPRYYRNGKRISQQTFEIGQQKHNSLLRRKAIMSRVGGTFAGMGGMMLGAGLNMGAQAIEQKRMQQIANGEIKENSNEDWRKKNTSTALSWAGKGASTGAMMGMMFGPYGALIGAAAGGLIGGIGGIIKSKKEQEKSLLIQRIAEFRNGQILSGNYSNSQLSRIAKYVETNEARYLPASDINALKQNGSDYNIVTNNVKMAKGGLIPGPTHANGGVAVSGTGIEVEGGEFVMNRQATVKNIGLLKQMNSGANIKPMPLNTQSMMVTPNNNVQVSNNGVSEINLKPLDININGTIKLDTGKGNQVDISKILLDNPRFLRDITEMIQKQININVNGTYNKEKSLKRF